MLVNVDAKHCTLPPLACPACGLSLVARSGTARAPDNWCECLRRCEGCGVGYSNGRDRPTIVFRDPGGNVPVEARDGVDECLAMALHEKNRAAKAFRFGFETSEDALTWTVFGYLHTSGSLLGVLRRAGLPIADGARAEALLLWGVPIPPARGDGERGWRLRDRLIAIADRLGESPGWRTEPDVVIDLVQAQLGSCASQVCCDDYSS